MPQQLDECNLGKPFQHRQSAAARLFHLIDNLLDRRLQPVTLVRAGCLEVQERREGVAKWTEVNSGTLQVAAKQSNSGSVGFISEEWQLSPRFRRQVNYRRNDSTRRTGPQLMSRCEREGDNIACIQRCLLAFHLQPAGPFDHDMKRHRVGGIARKAGQSRLAIRLPGSTWHEAKLE